MIHKDWRNRPVSELPWWFLVALIVALLWCLTAAVFVTIAVMVQFHVQHRWLVFLTVMPVAFWRVSKWV